MNNELGPVKPPFRVGTQLTGLAAKKAAALEAAKAAGQNIPVVIAPEDMPNRIGIVFDDSGSMQHEQIKDAHEGVEEFLRSCIKDQTAVAMFPMNREGLPLCSNLPAVAIFTKGIHATGGTPMLRTINKMLKSNNLSRVIVFSDGSPIDNTDENYAKVIEFKRPVDTVYIPLSGQVDFRAETFMKKLAEDTGGIYLQLERGKSNFRTAFKYLSPGLRHMLADKSFVAKLEGR